MPVICIKKCLICYISKIKRYFVKKTNVYYNKILLFEIFIVILQLILIM